MKSKINIENNNALDYISCALCGYEINMQDTDGYVIDHVINALICDACYDLKVANKHQRILVYLGYN